MKYKQYDEVVCVHNGSGAYSLTINKEYKVLDISTNGNLKVNNGMDSYYPTTVFRKKGTLHCITRCIVNNKYYVIGSIIFLCIVAGLVYYKKRKNEEG